MRYSPYSESPNHMFIDSECNRKTQDFPLIDRAARFSGLERGKRPGGVQEPISACDYGESSPPGQWERGCEVCWPQSSRVNDIVRKAPILSPVLLSLECFL